MFHLFDNVYLEHESRYSTKYYHYVLSSQGMKHPALRHTEGHIHNVIPFERFLKDDFGGSEEIFWNSIVENPKNRKLVLFVDDELLLRFQLAYWKSILKNPSVDNIYQLYSYHSLDTKLKRYLYVEESLTHNPDYQLPDPFKKEVIAEMVNAISPIEVFQKMDKSRVGFELLLANHFLSEKYRSSFMERLKELSWRAWFDDVEILRSEIINSFYDLKRIFPDASSVLPDVKLTEHFILSEPKLSWVLDPRFGDRDIDYVKKTYSKEMFMELGESILKFMEGKDNKVEEHILPTEYVFEDRYEELLQKNINKRFGCLFVNDQLKQKTNQLLPLLVYEKVRENKVSELSFMELN